MGRHSRETPKKKKVLAFIGGLTASAVLVGVGFGAYTFIDTNNRLKENSVDIGAPKANALKAKSSQAPKAKEPWELLSAHEGGFTTLLVGSDDGNGMAEKYGERDHALNDVTMVLHVSEDQTKATAISIPRDLFVSFPECEADGEVYDEAENVKVNSALSRGGLKCAVEGVSELIGQPIDYAAMIQFEGVVELSKAVGGIPVCVSSPINDPYTGLSLAAGEQKLEGDDALNFLRTRHGVGDGSDLGRISNQQSFLSSLMRTMKSSETLTNPLKVYNMAQAAIDNMTLSSNIADVGSLASLAYSIKDVNLNEITFLQYPTETGSVGNLEGLFPNEEDAQLMIDAVFSDESIEITGGTAPGKVGAIKQEQETPVDATQTPLNTEAPTPTNTTSSVLPDSITGQTAAEVTCSNGVVS